MATNTLPTHKDLEVTKEQILGDPTAPTVAQLVAVVGALNSKITQQAATITALQNGVGATVADALSHYTTAVVQPMFTALIGGSLPGSLDTLVELVNQLQADETGAAAMLASLNTLTTRVGTAEQALLGKVSTAALSTVQSAVTQNTADIGNRLRKDQADATTYPLGVPAAAAMDKAVQKSELAGGIQRPYRIFTAVGATPVGAYLRGTQTAPIVDSLGLGQVYALLAVRLKTITAPGLATTISLFKNGSGTAFYTQTVLLTNIPAVGKVLDILSLTTSLPADIVLPATITASSSQGTFEIIIDGLLK